MAGGMEKPSPRTLRKEIESYIRTAGGFEMPDLRANAEACQRRIEALGYEWDYQRELWRAPEKKSRKKQK